MWQRDMSPDDDDANTGCRLLTRIPSAKLCNFNPISNSRFDRLPHVAASSRVTTMPELSSAPLVCLLGKSCRVTEKHQ